MFMFSLVTRIVGIAVLAFFITACSGAQERSANYLQKGQKYFDQNNDDKARIEVRNALQINPKFVEARFLSGRIAERRGELREAVGHYQAAIEENPKYSPARAAMARLYLMGGLPDKAAELVTAGLADEPQNPALLTVRAGIEAQAGRVVPALEDAEAAYKLDPRNEYTIVLLASLYKQSARLDKAIDVIKAGSKQLPKSVDLHIVLADLEASRENYAAVQQQLQQVISLEPTKLDHRARLAQYFLFRKDVAGAESTWRQAIKDIPDQQDPKLALIDLLWSQRGEAQATAEMQTIMTREPNNTDLKLSMGGYLERQGKLPEAEQAYQQVVAKSKLEAAGLSARNRLAALYLRRNDSKLNDRERAEKLIGEVLKENGRDNDALILRANMAMQKGDAATAITDLRGVLRDQPNSAPLMRGLAKAHLQNQEVSLAEETLRSALQANPGDIPTRKELAQLLLQQNKPDQAKSLLDQLASIQGVSTDLEILDTQFKTQLLLKDFDAAQATAEKLQQLRPNAALGWHYAGLASEGKKSLAQARKNYETALEKQADAAEPLTALVRLDVGDKQNQRALQRLDKIIAANPGHAIAHNLKGEIFLSERQWLDAMSAYDKSIAAAPSWWTPYRGLALAQLGDKQSDAAIATYQLGIDKTRSNALSSDLAALYERVGKPQESIKTYEQWLQREPKSIVAANNLATLLLNYRSDKASLDQAVKLSELLTASNEPAILDTRGWVKFKTGDYREAVNLLQRAANAMSDSNTIRYHLGMAQWKAGDASAARGNLQAAVSNNKPFFGMDEARKTLAALSAAG